MNLYDLGRANWIGGGIFAVMDKFRRNVLKVRRTPRLRDEDKCFIFFEKKGTCFRGRDQVLLLHLPSSELHAQQLEPFQS